jgi:hypothetical protein
MPEPIPLSAVLVEEYVRLHVDADHSMPDELARALSETAKTKEEEPEVEKQKLKAIYAAIHALDEPRTALCFSGGGIRSATFALGVAQRLARWGLLSKFDYLSTVSGGGYIGSWLSSYTRRDPEGIADVSRSLNGAPPEDRDPLKPEINPLTWLRQFSNYLTPKLGLLSGDTWTFVASYVRNLFLNWLMFVPLLIALMALPRLGIALLRAETNWIWLPRVYAIIAGVCILYGTAVVASTRPVSYKNPGRLTNGRFLRHVLLPYFVGSLLLVLCWGTAHKRAQPWWALAAAAGFVAISLANSVWYMIRFGRASRAERRGNVRHDTEIGQYTSTKFWAEVIAATVSGLVAAGLLTVAATQLFDDPMAPVILPTLESWKQLPPNLSAANGELFLALGVPIVLAILFVQAAIFVGGASWYNEEYDREWWGRAAGWVLVAAVAWLVFAVIMLYGPVAIYEAPRTYAALSGVTGLFAILAGKSSKTPANDKQEKETASTATKGIGLSLNVIGPIFVVCILALVSLGTSSVLFHLAPDRDHISDKELAVYERSSHQIRFDNELINGLPANFQSIRFPAVETDKLHALEHLWIVDRTSLREGLILVFGFALFAWFASLFIGANQFSIHSLYRNRLIRAYLGASRFSRTPNKFSGFDPNDNLPMYRLKPETFWATSFTDDIGKLGDLLKNDVQLKKYIRPPTWAALEEAKKNPGPVTCMNAGDLLSFDLNGALEKLAPKPSPFVPPTILNRREIEKRYGPYIRPMDAHRRPMHVVNMTLNLVAGENLAWQERKGHTFTATPQHTGSFHLGYRDTSRYGGPQGVSLGTAVAISGAAASPNQGYNSSPALAILLTLFNVRLGWWWGNPKGDNWEARNPTNSLKTLLDEAFGLTGDEYPYIYLSDGGHFDNLGLYEMVLRRCRYMVLSDAGQDQKFAFDDLGAAIRKIRIDFGIRVEIENMALLPRPEPFSPDVRYCAVAKIRYSDVDPGAPDGWIVYIKPAFYGKKEPKDIYNYAMSNPAFPHQSTGDQWFSESQFESYRALGDFALGEVIGGKGEPATIAEFIAAAKRYVGLDEARRSSEGPAEAE